MPRIAAAKSEAKRQIETEPTPGMWDEGTPVTPANPIESEPPSPPVAVIERRIETVTIAVPLGETGNGFNPAHVEVWLKPPQAEVMQRMIVALRDKRETIADGREVRTAADAVRWLLERIGGPPC